MNGLFRNEVVQAQRAQWLGAVNLASPLSFCWWTLLAAALTTGIALFLAFGHYTQRAHVTGQLVPSTGLLTLTSNTTGTITRTLVQEGERVTGNQPLIEVSGDFASASMGDTHALVSTELRTQLAQAQVTLAGLQPQADAQARDLRARIGMLRAQMDQIGEQRTLQLRQADTAEQLLQKIGPLRKRGIISVAQFDQYQANALTEQAQVKALDRQWLDAGQQLSSLQAQLTQLPLDTAAKANQLRSQIAQLNASLAQNEAQRGVVLQAPRAGVISTLLVKIGQMVRSGQPLLSILPQGSQLQAQLLVPSSAIGFVETGGRVVLRYQAYPYQKFGQQYGRILQVSRSALSNAEAVSLVGENTPAPVYRVLVALNSHDIEAYGKRESLKPGMALDADILLDRRSLWQWVFEPLYGLRKQLATDGHRQG